MASAMSGGTAICFSAWRDISIARPSSERSQLAFMSVSTAPGAIAFTVIPRAPSSCARTRVMTSMAPFVAEYAVNIGFAKRQARKRLLDQEKDTLNIGVEEGIKVVLRGLGERLRDKNPGIRDQHVDRRRKAAALQGRVNLLEKRSDAAQAADIALDEHASSACPLDLPQHLLAVLLGPDVIDDHEKAVPRQAFDGGCAQATTRTGDDRDPGALVLRIGHAGPLCSRWTGASGPDKESLRIARGATRIHFNAEG